MQIIFPLGHRKLIRGAAAHIAAGLGAAVDYEADYEPLYAPVSGKIYLFSESTGGDWIQITDEQGWKWEFAHLSKRYVKTGDVVQAGQLIAHTGGRPGDPTAGSTTSNPHWHCQVIDHYPHRIDPQPLLDNAPLYMAFDTSFIGAEGTLVRIGVSPLRYGYILRGKRYEYAGDNNTLMLLYPLDKFKVVPVIRITAPEWDTIPKSDGVKF